MNFLNQFFIFLLTLNIVKCVEEFDILKLKSREDFENKFNRKHFYDLCLKIATKPNVTEDFEIKILKQDLCLQLSRRAFLKFWNSMDNIEHLVFIYYIYIYICK